MKEKTEDNQKLTDGEKLLNMTKSDGWAIFNDRYEDVMLRLADIRNIPFKVEEKVLSAEQRTYEMQVRERVLLYMGEIMDSLNGSIEEYNELLDGMANQKRDEGFIVRFDI